MIGALCSARLRNGDSCRSVATHDEFCAYHAALADDLGSEVVANGDQLKRRNARQREPVIAESEPFELPSRSPRSPSAVRPALALTAAEEVETIRRVLLEAATSTTRETWATCTCPECGKSFRQEISVPDHGARIKAVETLLREGLGRVGEAEIVEPRMPTFTTPPAEAPPTVARHGSRSPAPARGREAGRRPRASSAAPQRRRIR